MSPESGTPAEIVAVGRELLTGRTVDTNSAWLAARLTDLGAVVARIVAVDDDPAAIAREIADAHRRGAALVITTGGLGPTLDDRTLGAVAAALERRLVEHPDALAFVARRYGELAAVRAVADAALTPPRRKMARLPEGAEPVENSVGTAPGVLLRDGARALLALPGVPAEMRAVFDAALPRLRECLGAPAHVAEREVASGSGDESVLTVAVERVMDAVPGVHLKSLATAFAPDCDLRVRITARAATRGEAEALVAHAAERLAAELARLR
ncbi:MAG TPA: competence/damage-inducible protein A [Candidatus Limnocylindria bacterium]|jgi:molybdenum cofactor synthesis domain-containing protein|nr:competence/damage-inducible protein A [Candidatus Limnocylindria bacterium]